MLRGLYRLQASCPGYPGYVTEFAPSQPSVRTVHIVLHAGSGRFKGAAAR